MTYNKISRPGIIAVLFYNLNNNHIIETKYNRGPINKNLKNNIIETRLNRSPGFFSPPAVTCFLLLPLPVAAGFGITGLPC